MHQFGICQCHCILFFLVFQHIVKSSLRLALALSTYPLPKPLNTYQHMLCGNTYKYLCYSSLMTIFKQALQLCCCSLALTGCFSLSNSSMENNVEEVFKAAFTHMLDTPKGSTLQLCVVLPSVKQLVLELSSPIIKAFHWA